MATSGPKWPTSLPTRERGLKQRRSGDIIAEAIVAPHAGAWIETTHNPAVHTQLMSLPTRERGLKHLVPGGFEGEAIVAPHAGAWIETATRLTTTGGSTSRSPRGSVD